MNKPNYFSFKKNKNRNYEYILDICSKHIKVIRTVKENGGFFIDGIFALDKIKMPESKIKSFFEKLFSVKEKIKLTAFITRKNVIVEYFDLPNLPQEQLHQIIKDKIEEILSYPVSKIIFNWRILDSKDKDRVNVKVIAVHKDKIQLVFDSFLKYGVFLDEIILDTDAVVKWFNFSGAETEECTGIIDIDMDKISLIAVEKGETVFSKSLAAGFKDFSSDVFSPNSVLKELKDFLKICKKNFNCEIKKIILTGAEESFKYFLVQLREGFYGQIAVKSGIEGMPVKFSEDKLKKAMPDKLSFSCLMGAAVFSEEKLFNFLPKEMSEFRPVKNNKLKFKKIILCFLLLFCAVFFYASSRIGMLEKKLENLKSENNKILSSVSSSLKEMKFKKDFSDYLSRRTLAVELLKIIYDNVPKGIKLSRFSFLKEKNAVLEGYASDITVIFNFVSNLEKTLFFKSVKTDKTDKKINNKTISFSIICQLK